MTDSPAMVVLILNIFLLIAGCLLDPTPILLITVPVLAPLIVKVGIDRVHFGVVMVLNPNDRAPDPARGAEVLWPPRLILK